MCETPVSQTAAPLPCAGTNFRIAICNATTLDEVLAMRTQDCDGGGSAEAGRDFARSGVEQDARRTARSMADRKRARISRHDGGSIRKCKGRRLGRPRNCVPSPRECVMPQRIVSTRPVHNIALIGFMGTGKSTVGRMVAEMLHFTFLDTDHVIEARAGRSVADIFAHDGEAVFREWERRI